MTSELGLQYVVPMVTRILLLMVAIPLTMSAEPRQGGRPQQGVMTTNYGPAPASLDQLWAEAGVVLRGRIEHSVVRPAVPDGQSVVTDHRVQVLEILKDDDTVRTAKQVHVLQPAGTLEIGGVRITADPGSMPVFAPGQELLLFLNEWKRGSGYGIAFGPAGVFVLDNDVVELPAAARNLAPAFGGGKQIDKAEFLKTLRQRVTLKQPVQEPLAKAIVSAGMSPAPFLERIQGPAPPLLHTYL